MKCFLWFVIGLRRQLITNSTNSFIVVIYWIPHPIWGVEILNDQIWHSAQHGQYLLINRVPRGRKFSAAELWKAGTTSIANVIVEEHSNEYNIYAITRPVAFKPKGT